MKYFLIFLLSINVSFAQFDIFSNQKAFSDQSYLNKREFFSLLQIIEDEFRYLADERNETLTIYGDFSDPTADMAFSRRWGTDAHLLIYGGLAYRKELDQDSLALIICHELGHLYGGQPMRPDSSDMAVEGQADYWGAGQCLEKTLALLKDNNRDLVGLTIQNKCLGERICERKYLAALRVSHFLAVNWNVARPKLETPSSTIVSETNFNHPEPQCRLDTYVAAFQGKERPACWYYSIQTR